ncbi:MAG: energy-coupling factor ABC transporter ATP-binding protein [Nitrospirae bacterium]|nr:energy-coupling factor ABC transporter ATP-binding protein [Nitrospirota bacterium]MBF0536425.1 energy-coupling factor ABC transporter ATP-binding protein [Nitrospirota bacterium]MBF0618364.1 energy-coupling factor ABC transporter ATP-binding protein [Nitrospirota bacterium]
MSRCYALCGANGAGKSTLLRICALIEKPDSGDIFYTAGDRILPHDIELRRRMTLLLPNVGVFNTTVYKNVAYGLKVRKKSRVDIDKITNETLDMVGLKEKDRQNALTLSTGETARMGIARALAITPGFLFLDEPTNGIDTKNYEIIKDILLEIKTNLKTTILIATHDTKIKEQICDTVLVISEGRIADEKV